MSGRNLLLLGACMPCYRVNTAKIRIRRMIFDNRLNMYFNKDQFLFAHDPEKMCKTGDMVLIKELAQRPTRLLTHKVVKVVYPLGDVTDPITGKAVVGDKYRDQIDQLNEIYGKSEKAFDYEKAPVRGRLEGKRDFTHGRTYIKYNEDGQEQPFAV